MQIAYSFKRASVNMHANIDHPFQNKVIQVLQFTSNSDRLQI